MPSNFHRSDWAGRPFGSLPGVQAVYTLPLAHAEMPVDEETSKHFQLLVAAADDVSFEQACEKLVLLREDDRVPEGKRLHFPAFRNLLSSLCAVAILQRPWKGHRVLCSCCSMMTIAWDSFSFGQHTSSCFYHSDMIILELRFPLSTDGNLLSHLGLPVVGAN